ncbi:MAG: hypothetical protein JWP57_265 [Spirosoma sp.]|nr:hypothetical protein [Spirosoma sp.]
MTTATNVMIIRQSGLRAISENEVLEVFSKDETRLAQHPVLVDMQAYPIEGGDWTESEGYILNEARKIREYADQKKNVKIAYFGIAEVPHIIALGAFLSDQYHVDVFGWDRDKNSWEWRATENTLNVVTNDWPKIVLPLTGSAIIRVELSAFVADADVEEAVGKDHLADIRIHLGDGRTPMIGAGIVQSPADVQHVRETFRQALAELKQYRPNVNLIHLFVAAPVPVCFVIGQELQLRNNIPIQTYRFRIVPDQPSQKKAIYLTGEEAESATRTLTPKQKARARKIRTNIWPEVLKQVQHYAETRKREARDQKRIWFEYLTNHEDLIIANPFPRLPPIWEVVDLKDTVSNHPRPTEYGHPTDSNEWELSDSLLIDLSNACRDDDELKQLIRLFLFHEYLHIHHSLNKYNVELIGRFANCLEKLDYEADLYALLHQLDYTLFYEPEKAKKREKEFLEEQLDLILRSTWAFVQGATVNRPQVRAVRRLLNWYWRHVQVQRADRLVVALAVLSKAPTIELIGPMLSVGSSRVYMSMVDLDKTVELSLGIVLENEKFLRREDAVNFSLKKLLDAFRTRDHNSIKKFFLGIFEEAKEKSGSLPAID